MNRVWRCLLILFYTLFLAVSVSVGQKGNIDSEKNYGIVVCSGEGEIFLETLTMVEQTRFRLGSKLPMTVAHCNELSERSISILLSITGVKVMNLCTPDRPFYVNMKPRLNGFFCKPAALLLSPYEHTMLVDSDVIFFKKPELLFDSQQYQLTGTLFFRDRWTLTKNKLSLTKGQSTGRFAFDFIKSAAEMLKLNARKKNNGNYSKNNGNYSRFQLNITKLMNSNAFWGHLAGEGKFTVDHWQDSSVLLFSSASHPLTLKIIKHFLGSFNSGYGDKEMYWLSATAAKEPFAFEPHVAGSLGDCGALIHFDPRLNPAENYSIKVRKNGKNKRHEKEELHVDSNVTKSSTAEPFYINAEYFIDHKVLKNVSDFLNSPYNLITNPLPMDELISTSPLSRYVFRSCF